MHHDLLSRLRARDPDAQREIRSRHHPTLLRQCRLILGDGVQAEETAEDLWTDFLFIHVDAMRNESAIGSYLKVTAIRRCLRLKTAAASHQAFGEHLDDAPDPERALIDASTTRLEAQRLAACLSRLRPQARRVLRLRYGSELTQDVIGARLGVSKQYVGRVLSKSIENLRRCLGERS